MCLALLWTLPFCLPDHKVPVGTFWQEWAAAALLVSAVFFALAQERGMRVIHMPGIAWALVGLAAVITLQYVGGLLNLSANLIIPLLYLTLALLACVFARTLLAHGHLERLCTWIAMACLIGGIFNVQVQIAQLLGMEKHFPFMSTLLPGQRPFGNINQSNHIAAYLGLALGSTLYLRVNQQLSWPSTWASVLILIAGLSLSGQRSAMVYVCMPLVITLLAWRTLPAQRPTLLKLGLTLPLLLAVINPLISLLHATSPLLMERLASVPLYSNRWNFWQHTILMVQSHPLLGVGFGQYWSAFFEQLDVLPSQEAANNPHNLIAALLSETGLIGTAVVLVPLLLWVWRTRLAAASMLQWLALLQILIIGFHSLVEYPLWYSYFLIILAFWLGAADKTAHSIKLRHSRYLAGLFLLMAWGPLLDIAANYQKLRNMLWSVPHARMMDMPHFQSSIPQPFEDLSGHWFFHREMMFWQTDFITVSPEHLAVKIAANQQTLKIAPSSRALFSQVLMLVLNGQVDDAVRLLKRAQQVYPARYQEMRHALPYAAQQWPEQFGPAMPQLLLESPSPH